jgi:hypothetical protein
MPRCGVRFDENVGGALRAAILLADKTFQAAPGTAPPTFRLFSSERGRDVRAPRSFRQRGP